MTEKISFYYEEKGDYKPREGLPFVKRKNIAAIIKYNHSYLFLAWNEVNYDNFLVTGGVLDDEEIVEALKREVVEETGYFDFKKIVPIDCINVSRFYVEHKNVNREAIYYPYLVELNSLDQNEILEAEKKEHKCIWVEEKNLDNVKLFDNHRKMLMAAIDVI